MGGLQAQTDFESIEQQILDTYQILKTAHLEHNPERQGIFSAKLKNQLMFALLQNGSYYYPFLRLRQYIKVVESLDKRIRVFSWDALGLDAWRSVCSLAQYRGVQNESYFYVLSDGSQSAADYRDVFINKIYLLNSPTGMPYYLLLGNGSHGIGQEHTTLRIFYFGHNQLLECKDCLEGNLPYWTIKGSTQFPVELSYHPRRKTLYYYQPSYNAKTGKRARGLHYQLYWKDGFFRAY
jgi:hypothetical protein